MAGLVKKQIVFTRNVAKLIDYIFSQGYFCTLGEAYRTEEQALLYAQQGKGIKASLHCKRLAIDLNLFSPSGKYLTASEDHKSFGTFWESLDKNNVWGGNFNDGNHYQMSE